MCDPFTKKAVDKGKEFVKSGLEKAKEKVVPLVLNPSITAGTEAAAAGGRAVGREVGELLTPDINIPPPADIIFPEPPPRAVDPVVTGARARERARARGSRGRQSTILTGSGGLSTSATTSPKTLLGQ